MTFEYRSVQKGSGVCFNIKTSENMDELEELIAKQAKIQARILGIVMQARIQAGEDSFDDSDFLRKPWRKTAETADFLGISSKTLLRQKNRFTHRQLGNTYIFESKSIVAYLNRKERKR